MLKDITIGQYYPTTSVIHSLDPRMKLCFTISLMIALFIVNSAISFAIFALFLFFILRLANVPIKLLWQGIKALLWIFIFTIAMNLFWVKGETFIQLPVLGIAISQKGAELAFVVVCRLILTVALTSLFTLTTSPFRMMDALEKLLSPLKKLKFPIGEMALMMMMSMRFIPLLIDESEKLIKAQKSRGADLDSKNPIIKVRNLVPILVPLFASSLRRSEEVAIAMESRCFIPGAPRTQLYELKLKRSDWVAFILVLSFMALIFIADRIIGIIGG